MILEVKRSKLHGRVRIPGSKSHTIRALMIALLAEGTSEIIQPLDSLDTRAALSAIKQFGADIVELDNKWVIKGVNGKPNIPDDVINVGNSGTTLYFALGIASIINGTSVLTGDSQIRRRPAEPLINALNSLGANLESTKSNGMAPIIVKGPAKGGTIFLDGSKTSQYLSSLLISCPLMKNDSVIIVDNLVELPYVEMTLKWLEEQDINFEVIKYKRFNINGGQSYSSFRKQMPSDFSSATFFLCAAAVTKSNITIDGLDMNDSQGDKAIINILKKMGCKIKIDGNSVGIECDELIGNVFDLNDTPDALPALAVTACFAEGETRLINVSQARLKETDRIKVMHNELKKAGANIEELPDGLIIRKSQLKSCKFDGHSDHRVVMALSLLGMAVDGETNVNSAEYVSVTFPEYVKLMQNIGAKIVIH